MVMIMYPNKRTNKVYVNHRNEPNLATVKITGPTTEIVAEIQYALAELYEGRITLSPILQSQPDGYHAFCTILGDPR